MSDVSLGSLAAALPDGSGVCVINLDERNDRWEEFQKRISPHFAGVPIIRVSATRGVDLPGYGERPLFRGKKRDKTWGARGGCVLSHRDALIAGKENGWTHVLVLEDDVCLSAPEDTDFAVGLKKQLEQMNPEVCYFGFTDPVQPFRKEVELGSGRAIHRVYGCNTGHAYLVSQSAIEAILPRLPSAEGIWKWLTRHRAVDRFYYRNLSPELVVTAISPPLINQMEGYSDIMGKQVTVSEAGHVTEVPEDTQLKGSYSAALKQQAAKFRREGIYDTVRGWLKYVRGF